MLHNSTTQFYNCHCDIWIPVNTFTKIINSDPDCFSKMRS